MKKYMLSIDPSLNNTGFTLWEKKEIKKCNNHVFICDCKEAISSTMIFPIETFNYSFKKYNSVDFLEKIKWPIRDILNGVIDKPNWLNDLDLFIERGFHLQNRNTTESLDSLRGNIFGLFNKLYIPKENGISPTEWRCWYIKSFTTLFDEDNKWNKEKALSIAEWVKNYNNWDININNDHDIAESLLIGWYVINNKVD